MTKHLRAPADNTAPTIPATTKRAIDEWTAKGCRVIVEGGRIEVIPPAPNGDDLDLVDFRRRK